MRRLALAILLAAPVAWAAEPVDMLLVLAADVSRSVTEPKFRLQRDGAAAAITHPDVVKAITAGPNRRIAVCFIEWATVGMQSVVVDWTVIGSDAGARGFGDRLVEAPRSFIGSTSISSAIDFAVSQLERAPFKSERHVIDVSGGDKIPRKGGPGITQADLLVINKTDLAALVGADLGVMERDAKKMRGARPYVMSNLRTGDGVAEIARFIEDKGGLGQ